MTTKCVDATTSRPAPKTVMLFKIVDYQTYCWSWLWLCFKDSACCLYL